jgi:hypothetical protein
MAEGLEVKVANEMALEQTQVLLRALAGHFSNKTKLVAVPSGTRHYAVATLNHGETSTKVIELHQFFGMYVGYDVDLDMLVCWLPQ